MGQRFDPGMSELLGELINEAICTGWEIKTFREVMMDGSGWTTVIYAHRGFRNCGGIGGMVGTGFPDDMPEERLESVFYELLRSAIYTG